MENYPITQLVQALSSVLFGAALGLLYDLLRALRRRSRVFTGALDALFCFSMLFLLFFMGMDFGGGELRIFMTLCCACGLALYLSFVSPFVLPIVQKLLTFLLIPLKFVNKIIKEVAIFLKKLFQYPLKWFKMIVNIVLTALPARENPRDTDFLGEECLHGTQNKYYSKASTVVGNDLRRTEPRLALGRSPRRTKRKRRRRT